jgi:hypothetical protein
MSKKEFIGNDWVTAGALHRGLISEFTAPRAALSGQERLTRWRLLADIAGVFALPRLRVPGYPAGRAGSSLNSSATAINTEGEATMKPRQVTVLLRIALGAVLAPLVVNAQAPTKVARIGWMSRGNPTANDLNMDAFRQGMRELGYVEGKTFVMEPRYAGAKSELMPEQAAELERAGVDVIIAGPFEALQAAKQSTSYVPIIMTPSADPIATARGIGDRRRAIVYGDRGQV